MTLDEFKMNKLGMRLLGMWPRLSNPHAIYKPSTSDSLREPDEATAQHA